jgi:subtilisin family serine protease
MMQTPRSPLKTLCLALAAAAALVPASHAKGSDPQVAGNVLLRVHSTADLAPLVAKYQLTVLGQFGARPIYRVKVPAGTSVSQTVAALKLEPPVRAAEPNFVHSSPEARKNVVWAIGTAVEYATQWAPEAMKLPAAQQLSRGAGMRVAVLDTGVDATHPALAGKMLPGKDFVDGDSDASEGGTTADLGFGHGTHVAGLVALAAPDARIIPYRVLNPAGQGDVWMLAEALLHAIDPDGNPRTNDGAHVVNMSMGTVSPTSIMETVMQLSTCSVPDIQDPANDYTDAGFDGDKQRCADFSGAVVVAAAGNDASRSIKQYPAAEGAYGLMAMGATAENHRMATFSNTGSWVDLAAPGDHITSTLPGGGYGTWSGTSMSAPLAAGTAALIRSRFPRMKPADVAKRIEKYGAQVCNANIVQVDAEAALRGRKPRDLSCP